MDDKRPIKIGVGSCLVGNPVRYNGEHKRRNQFLEQLRQYFELVPFCPEVGIGMGVPREPIRLITTAEGTRVRDSATQLVDHTQALQQFAEDTFHQNPEMAGYIFVKGSPSCGLERVNRYTENGAYADKNGVGIYADWLTKNEPLLPVEEDGRLYDPLLREKFICQVYTWHAWLGLRCDGYSIRDLTEFWARHKYLVLARDQARYKLIGRLLANQSGRSVTELGEEFIALLMTALRRSVSRKGHSNALQHVKGYLKKHLTREESADIDRSIDQYRSGTVPLIVPITLLRHQFRKYPHPYIDEQLFLTPYPDELSLRNEV